jgi:hypothetical protein
LFTQITIHHILNNRRITTWPVCNQCIRQTSANGQRLQCHAMAEAQQTFTGE